MSLLKGKKCSVFLLYFSLLRRWEKLARAWGCWVFYFFFREWENLIYFCPLFLSWEERKLGWQIKRERMPKEKKIKPQTWKDNSWNASINLINIWFSIELLKKWIELLVIAMESGSCVPPTSVAPGSNLISANAQFFPLKMQRLLKRRLAGCAQHIAELGE